MCDDKWVTKDYLESLLRSDNGESKICVKKFSVKPALGPGQNFLSTLYKITVEIESDGKAATKHLIVKRLPPGEFLNRFVGEQSLFQKEIQVYSKVMPLIDRIWKERAPQVQRKTLMPKYYEDNDDNCLAMEDLNSIGFTMVNRRDRLDLNHCLLVIRKIAQFHAASVIGMDQWPELFERFNRGFYQPHNKAVGEALFKPAFEKLSKELETWEGFERFGEKISQFAAVYFDETCLAADKNNSEFSVLNHGDLHVNNIMFSFSENNLPEEIKLLDFQISMITTPVWDIIYFLRSSARDDVYYNHFDFLLEEYHKALKESLDALGSKVKCCSLECLKRDKIRLGKFTVYVAGAIMAVMLSEPESSMDFNALSEEDIAKCDTGSVMGGSHSNMIFRTAFSKALLDLEGKGII